MLFCLLFCCSTAFSCALSIEGITGERIARWLRIHTTKKAINGLHATYLQVTNPSNWPYFHLGQFCASTRCSHWHEHCFGHMHFRRHWFTQLLQPWFALHVCVIIAHEITHKARSTRWFHWCELECASTSMCIRVWTLKSTLNVHYRYCLNQLIVQWRWPLICSNDGFRDKVFLTQGFSVCFYMRPIPGPAMWID